jgi:hypothetical protein
MDAICLVDFVNVNSVGVISLVSFVKFKLI